MKYCQSCGELIDDAVAVCPKCGSTQSVAVNQQPTNTQSPIENVSQQYDYAQAATALEENISGKKKSSKKALFITLGILAAAAIAFCVWFFVFHSKSGSDKKEIEQKTGEYIEAICDFNVEKIIGLTIPKDVLQQLVNEMFADNLSEFGYDTSASFDDNYSIALEDAQDYVDSFTSDYQLSIDVNDYKITSIDKMNIDDVIETIYYSDPELSASESLRDIKGIVKETAKEYGIDTDKIYNVYVTVDATVNANGEQLDFNSSALAAMFGSPSVAMHLPFEIIDKDGGIALFMAYKHDSEYYLIPNIGIYAPQIIKYQQKASIAADISNASVIYTAVQTMLAYEDYYNFFTGEGANCIYTIDDYELNNLPAECGQELRELIYVNERLPIPSLRQNGQAYFGFMVDTDGTVYIYVLDAAKEKKWELMPDQTPPYNY